MFLQDAHSLETSVTWFWTQDAKFILRRVGISERSIGPSYSAFQYLPSPAAIQSTLILPLAPWAYSLTLWCQRERNFHHVFAVIYVIGWPICVLAKYSCHNIHSLLITMTSPSIYVLRYSNDGNFCKPWFAPRRQDNTFAKYKLCFHKQVLSYHKSEHCSHWPLHVWFSFLCVCVCALLHTPASNGTAVSYFVHTKFIPVIYYLPFNYNA